MREVIKRGGEIRQETEENPGRARATTAATASVDDGEWGWVGSAVPPNIRVCGVGGTQKFP